MSERCGRVIAFAMVLCGVGLAGCRQANVPGRAETPTLSLTSKVFRDVNPRWSHDGKSIAFFRETPDRKHQLFLGDSALQSLSPLRPPEVLSPDRDYAPHLLRYASPNTLAFTPNDRQIVYPRVDWMSGNSGERLPGLGLWVIGREGGEPKPFAVHPPRYRGGYLYFRYPQWSPGGRYLSFVGEGMFGQRVVFLRNLTRNSPLDSPMLPDLSEDSDWATWETTRPALTWRQSVRRSPSVPFTETLRRATPGANASESAGDFWRRTAQETKASPAHPHASHLVWSPDGKRLAFALTSDPLEFGRYEIWIVERDGTGARRVSPQEGRGYFAPVWIGGERIGALSPNGNGTFSVVSWNLKTGETRSHGVLESSDCDWSPDRTRIVYTTPKPVKAGTTLRILLLR